MTARVRRVIRCLGYLSIALFAVCAQNSASQRADWNRPMEPFRIIGNVYYVGAAGVSSFLIAGKQGSVLLDGGFAETAPQIEKNIAALGFRLNDVHLLLNSHAHFDHAGGLAELKKASDAKMVASAGDRQTLESGHQLSYGKGQSDSRFPAVKVDRVITNGETVSLGDIRLTAYLTPGHTKGCTTWTAPVSDHGKIFRVVFYCSTSVAGNQLVNNPKYPQIVNDYQHSFQLLRRLPCDVFLGPHPSFFEMEEKKQRLVAGHWDAFVNPGELAAFVDRSEKDFQAELIRQQRTAGN